MSSTPHEADGGMADRQEVAACRAGPMQTGDFGSYRRGKVWGRFDVGLASLYRSAFDRFFMHAAPLRVLTAYARRHHIPFGRHE